MAALQAAFRHAGRHGAMQKAAGNTVAARKRQKLTAMFIFTEARIHEHLFAVPETFRSAVLQFAVGFLVPFIGINAMAERCLKWGCRLLSRQFLANDVG